jgi:F-type H+-transporting ATPase subunit gamma
MELFSVIKMQKAVAANMASRPYTESAGNIIVNICAQIDQSEHLYLTPGKGNRRLVLIITTDRGLCGNMNAKVVKKLLENYGDGELDVIVIGKKGRDLLRQTSINVIAEFYGITDNLEFRDEYPILKLIESEYKSQKYQSVKIIYPHFISTLNQEAKILRLLPLKVKTADEINGTTLFEPDKAEVLNKLIPRVLETILWQALLETIASEHSARMINMKNANENAEELIDDLTLSFNQSRQASITRELAEISAGKMTLEE